MFTPDEYYNIVEFTGAGTRRDEVVEEIQQQQIIIVCYLWMVASFLCCCLCLINLIYIFLIVNLR